MGDVHAGTTMTYTYTCVISSIPRAKCHGMNATRQHATRTFPPFSLPYTVPLIFLLPLSSVSLRRGAASHSRAHVAQTAFLEVIWADISRRVGAWCEAPATKAPDV